MAWIPTTYTQRGVLVVDPWPRSTRVGIREHVSLRHLALLVLLTPPVPGHAPRLVHRQRRGHEQHQQAARGVDHELNPQPAEIGTGQCRLCRHACQAAHWLHVQQQDDGGDDGHQEFHQDPIVPEQAPLGAQ